MLMFKSHEILFMIVYFRGSNSAIINNKKFQLISFSQTNIISFEISQSCVRLYSDVLLIKLNFYLFFFCSNSSRKIFFQTVYAQLIYLHNI